MITLQQLHDAEISGQIDWLYDTAWHVEIGKPVLASATVSSEAEALAWLEAKAKELFGWEPAPERRERKECGMPDEWVLVPREPTEAMFEAAHNAMFDEPYDATTDVMIGSGWDAMLAASPTDSADAVKALEKAFRVLTYPVAREIDPRGYALRTDDDSREYAVELLAAALRLVEEQPPTPSSPRSPA